MKWVPAPAGPRSEAVAVLSVDWPPPWLPVNQPKEENHLVRILSPTTYWCSTHIIIQDITGTGFPAQPREEESYPTLSKRILSPSIFHCQSVSRVGRHV
jgi:hypothetical protein